MASPMLLYESLDVIGNGSFGIIRKVRRKSDGVIFARKELNFERMTERDRKQIVAEVNILKDLHHEHIVRYHDRYVDRDAGILYIVMEYCGGGDLSSVIKQAQRSGRPIPEDTIWSYFMQILLALNYCHHPHGHGRSSSTGSAGNGEEGKEKRPQILHRDLKPDNVFLDELNTVKLGDFGLSKALAQTTFANTYVGTPYYMSPELMQEKAYDSKSDIWSLGCVIYELCALKPPFAEAKTHNELSILIRNGRIPPLPKGYSPALTSVIKAMLNLNPAMRPSASQLLQHERLTLAHKVSETEKLLATVKAHKATVQTRERDLAAREVQLAEREAQLTNIVAQKDNEIASLRALLAQADDAHQTRVRQALAAREEELRGIVVRKEAELAGRLAKREEEVMEAVNRREEEVAQAWLAWEKNVRDEVTRAVDERMEWVQRRAEELEKERERLDEVRKEVEKKMELLEVMEGERRSVSGRLTINTTAAIDCGKEEKEKRTVKAKSPLEEVKNILAMARQEHSSHSQGQNQTPSRSQSPSKASSAISTSNSLSCIPPIFSTPMSRTTHTRFPSLDPPASAMKGVILTQTGEVLPTPSPTDVGKLFVATPRVRLDFAQIFEYDSDAGGAADGESEEDGEGYETDTRVPSRANSHHSSRSNSNSNSTSTTKSRSSSSGSRSSEKDDTQETPKQNTHANGGAKSLNARPTRLRRPSIRASASRDNLRPVLPTSASNTAATASAQPAASAASLRKKKSSSREPLSRAAKDKDLPPEYDFSDEENLPSPFLRRVDRDRITRTNSVPAHMFPQQPQQPQPLQQRQQQQQQQQRTAGRKSGDTLRTLALANAANMNNGNGNSNASLGKKGGMVKVASMSARVSAVNLKGGDGRGLKTLVR